MGAFPRPFWHIAVLFFLLVGAASDAKSAQIQLAPTNDPDRNVIVITGEFKVGDDAIFADIAIKAKSALVLFGSPGGALYPAIQIGKAIRLKGFATFVADGLQCASACALAWLAGQPRAMGPNARIGFHAASIEQNGERVIASTGNALVGGYLTQLGFSDSAIAYATSAGPESARWLTPSEAQRYGIEVKILETPSSNTPSPRQLACGHRTPREGDSCKNPSKDKRLVSNLGGPTGQGKVTDPARDKRLRANRSA